MMGFQKESPVPEADFQVNHVKLKGCRFLGVVVYWSGTILTSGILAMHLDTLAVGVGCVSAVVVIAIAFL